MSIATELENYRQGLTEAYGMVEEKGGTLPEKKNLANLSDSISSISGGGEQMPTFDEYYSKNRPAEWPVLPDPEDNEIYCLFSVEDTPGDEITIYNQIRENSGGSLIASRIDIQVYNDGQLETVYNSEIRQGASITVQKAIFNNHKYAIARFYASRSGSIVSFYTPYAMCSTCLEMKIACTVDLGQQQTLKDFSTKIMTLRLIAPMNLKYLAYGRFSLEAISVINPSNYSVGDCNYILMDCANLVALPDIDFSSATRLDGAFMRSGLYGDIVLNTQCGSFNSAFYDTKLRNIKITTSATSLTTTSIFRKDRLDNVEIIAKDCMNIGSVASYASIKNLSITCADGFVLGSMGKGDSADEIFSLGKAVVIGKPTSISAIASTRFSRSYSPNKVEIDTSQVVTANAPFESVNLDEGGLLEMGIAMAKNITKGIGIFKKCILPKKQIVDLRDITNYNIPNNQIVSSTGFWGIDTTATTPVVYVISPFTMDGEIVNVSKALFMGTTGTGYLSSYHVYIDGNTKMDINCSATIIFSSQFSIYVADSLYDTYMADSNWSSLGTRLKKHSEYVGPGIPPRA